MYNEKKYKITAPNRRKYLLSAFKGINIDYSTTTLPCDYTADCVNFGFNNNKLVKGIKLRDFDLYDTNGEIVDLSGLNYNAPYLDIFTVDNVGALYPTILVCSKREMYYYYPSKFDGWNLHYLKNGVRKLLRCRVGDIYLTMVCLNTGEALLMGNGEVKTMDNALKLADMCEHFGKVFAVEMDKPNTIWFCKSFDPTNWNASLEEGGYITIDGTLGKVNRVLSFQNYVFIFSDYGIYRLTAYFDQTEFSVKKLYSTTARIYEETVVMAGGYIVYTAEDGVYKFNGYDSVRINNDINKKLVNANNIKSAFCKNEYYIYYETQLGEKTIIRLNLYTNEINISSGLNIVGLTVISTRKQNNVLTLDPIRNRFLAFEDDDYVDDLVLPSHWKSCEITFNNLNDKLIREVEYNSNCDFKLKIIADGKESIYNLKSKYKQKTIRVKGKKFTFEILAEDANPIIGDIRLTVDFINK